jgi:hypothetical protein
VNRNESRIRGAACCRALAVIAALTLPACDQDESRVPPRPVTRDSAGVRLVEIANLAALELEEWRVSASPTVTIGANDGEPGHDLFGVRGAGVLSDGRIVVGDGTTGQLRFFSENGALVATSGRIGSGPGEFRALLWLQVLPGDTIVTYDYMLRRVTRFSADGEPARSYDIAPPTDAGYPEPRGAVNDGSIVFVPGFDRRFGQGERRDTVPFFLYDDDGTLVGPVASFPGREEFFARMGEAAYRSEVPFGRDVLAAAGADLIAIATNDTYAISLFDPSGRLRGIVRAAIAGAPVGPRELEHWKEEKLARLPDERRQRFAIFYEDLPARSTHPPFTALQVDRSGLLWIGRPSRRQDRNTWDVFGQGGDPVARIEMPSNLKVLDIGPDHVLALARDGADREVIVVYSVQRQ